MLAGYNQIGLDWIKHSSLFANNRYYIKDLVKNTFKDDKISWYNLFKPVVLPTINFAIL